ncbi:hypothetical protein TSOC_007431 [Tetrabaena socialis]|uniref:phytol kinase n=1 Tax=Tetrabaena socialis TaxID=47790 RepID=A0A2J8A123_9CHLO|nr:hypothetical protein TSOC_007431 [Tetrabaena socialis]|eukprot:PNH06219.1 hypothetical protein TSOC_007431 [Tetrabaena socialis]
MAQAPPTAPTISSAARARRESPGGWLWAVGGAFAAGHPADAHVTGGSGRGGGGGSEGAGRGGGGGAKGSSSAEGPRAADPTYDWREGTLVTGGGGEGGASSSSSGALGAPLLAAEAPPAGWPAVRACCNPSCVELAGASEAELPLRVCGGCGVARYCSGQCQKAHWAQGHRRACARRP